jgi:hypothetical protein
MPDDATTKDATPDEETRSDATSSAAVPTKPSAAVKNRVTAADNDSARGEAHSAWDRGGDLDADSDDDDQADKVLEVPQALPSPDPQPSDDSDQTVQEDGSQSPDDQDPTPDQVGSIEDYEDEEDGVLMGGLWRSCTDRTRRYKPLWGERFSRTPAPPGWLWEGLSAWFRAHRPAAIWGRNSAILPTSPMFPSGSARFSGGMPFPHGIGFSGGIRGGRR